MNRRTKPAGTGRSTHAAIKMFLVPKAAFLALAAAFALPALVGCESAGIAMKEQFGYAKRDQLVARVEDARDAQNDAKEQFQTTLEQFMAVAGTSGGSDLESKYKSLNSQYERSESRAKTVRDRIASVELVGGKLFSEWQSELSQYSDAGLRAASERQLNDTRAQYDKLVGLMKNASSRMDPVLSRFKDQVLFLKHNLNAQAVASLEGTSRQIEMDVSGLIKEMEAAIAEAETFIGQMKKS